MCPTLKPEHTPARHALQSDLPTAVWAFLVLRKCESAGLWEAAFSKGPFPYNGGIYLKTQLESQLNPSADEREVEKKAKQKRRRKKPAAQASQVPQSSSQNTAGAAPEAPAPTQPPKKKRTSPYPGQVMPLFFPGRAGISSAGSARPHRTRRPRLPRLAAKRKAASKKKSAQPQKPAHHPCPQRPDLSRRPRQAELP